MFIDEIVARVRSRLEEKKRVQPLAEVRRLPRLAPAPREFTGALRKAGFGIIAEIKKASPAKGWLRGELDIIAQARLYERGGASAISVLTEPDYFHGSLDDLKSVRDAVSLPVLRKDFIFEPYQVYEARSCGADAVLLIARILPPAALADLIHLTSELKMAALVEVHDAPELETALRAGARLIGVNNRNLADFTIDLNTTLKLMPMIPPGILVVSESGISTREQAAMMKDAGVSAILVGEALVTAGDPAEKIKELLGKCPLSP
ncbi:MAG: indole-3-glycerol phosphate synthase TrpC [Chloroflexi bacterium]|nr:indole-3-glycerol phosphate synthase TrpC [Chloroflexota bacterium]